MKLTRETFLHLASAVAIVCGLMAANQAGAQDDRLLNAVRRDDTVRAQALLEAGVDLNRRDDIGATPLMWGAAVSSPEMVRAMLDLGADVNASTSSGSTALMWATGDISKVSHGTAAHRTRR